MSVWRRDRLQLKSLLTKDEQLSYKRGSWPTFKISRPTVTICQEFVNKLKGGFSILHSKSHDMVRCGLANRSWGGEWGTNRRTGWGRAPKAGWAAILPAEANLITAFMELPLLHPAKIVSASSFRVTFHSHCRQIPHKTRSNKIFRYYPILLLEITC